MSALTESGHSNVANPGNLTGCIRPGADLTRVQYRRKDLRLFHLALCSENAKEFPFLNSDRRLALVVIENPDLTLKNAWRGWVLEEYADAGVCQGNVQ